MFGKDGRFMDPMIFSYVIYGVVAFFALLGAILGFTSGAVRQTLRLITIVLAAVVAFILAMNVYPVLFSKIEGKTIGEIAASIKLTIPDNIKAYVDCLDTQTAAYVATIPIAIVVVPLVFIVFFILLSFILYIVFAIVAGVLGCTKRRNNIITRFVGMLVGLIQGVIVAGLILMPVIGIVGVADDAVGNAQTNYPDAQNATVIAEKYHYFADPVLNNKAFTVYDKTLGFMYEKFVTVNVNGEKVTMNKVASDGFEIFVLYGELSGIDFAAPSEEHKATIDKMINTFGNDTYMTTIVSGLMRGVVNANEQGLLPLGSIGDENMMNFINEFIAVFENSSSATIKEDISTTEKIYFILGDSGAFKALTSGEVVYEDVFSSLLSKDEGGKSAITRVSEELQKNPRTARLATELNHFAVSTLMSGIGIVDAETVQIVENVRTDLNEIIAIDKDSFETEEEYKQEVSSKIEATLEENQITGLDDEQLAAVTDFVVTEFEGKEEITDAEITSFIAQYYDVYVKEMEGQGE